MKREPYYFGTDITLEKLYKILPKHNVDGTKYKIEKWLEECSIIDSLIEGKSKVFIPYGVNKYGILKEILWKKYEFKNYSFPIKETNDWWIYEPYMLVNITINNEIKEYYVYEYTYYLKSKRKSQWNHIEKMWERGKQKFLSSKDMSELKRQESIQNSISRRK